jgi:hypothetical protein
MERISQEQIEQLRLALVGKRVRVRNMAGICKYFGYNEYIPSFGLQVTIERTPVTNLKLTDITLLD